MKSNVNTCARPSLYKPLFLMVKLVKLMRFLLNKEADSLKLSPIKPFVQATILEKVILSRF